ncbi:MAG: hypothetical protein HY517_02665 [Candidatus Aenigmarchaeota archaeon]|nr:hypothetical protein [Candidatus Aenigmarchaeota archaeon]
MSKMTILLLEDGDNVRDMIALEMGRKKYPVASMSVDQFERYLLQAPKPKDISLALCRYSTMQRLQEQYPATANSFTFITYANEDIPPGIAVPDEKVFHLGANPRDPDGVKFIMDIIEALSGHASQEVA